VQKEETRSYYENKVRMVTDYIHDNPGNDLSIKTLSEKFNISYFHFHRIMQAALNEPLGNYISRVRLSVSARMIKEGSESLSNIAEKVGFNNLSAFSKSFTKEYGISPQEYRLSEGYPIHNEIDLQFERNGVVKARINPQVKTIHPSSVLCVEAVGEYGAKEVYEIWEAIIWHAVANGLYSWHPDLFSIYYDDPEETGVANCRYDCCLSIKKEFVPEGNFKVKEFDGGKFLVFRYKGSYDNLWEAYNLLYRDYIILLDKYQLRDAPIVERYIKFSERMKPENYITELCIPIE